MSEPSRFPIRRVDDVVRPDWKRVRATMRVLASVVESETAEESEARFDQFMARAAKSLEHTETAVAATQALRDLGVIDRAETACLLESLYQPLQEEYEEADPGLRRIEEEIGALAVRRIRGNPDDPAAESAEEARLQHALARRMEELKAEFHRARGEDGFADLILNSPSEYLTLTVAGYDSLVDDKVPADQFATPPSDPRKVALISERIIGLAASETGRETLREWRALSATGDGTDPASDVTAVQNVRALGLISDAEAMELVHSFLDSAFSSAIDADRQCVRLRKAMEAIEVARGLENGATFERGTEPFEWRVLEQQLERRIDGIMACCLRRFGQHRMANILIERRADYYRIVNEGRGIGAWGVPG